MWFFFKRLAFIPLLTVLPLLLSAQASDSSQLSLWDKAPTFNKARFWAVTGTGAAAYTATTIGLNQLWYAGYPRSNFRFFNDMKGWRYMDKMGHSFTAYFESKWVGQLYAWTGMRPKAAAWAGVAGGTLFQTTLEILDAFSAEWGFSWGDIAFNTLGSAAYIGQEYLWREQRFLLKVSAHRPHYSDAPLPSKNGLGEPTSLAERARALYGTGIPSMFIKEYNGVTIWASGNIAAFCKTRPRWLPPWLNIAVGYGAGNMFGAESNRWTDKETGAIYQAADSYPRYSQLFFALDVDFERIPTKSKALKSLFGLLNILKVPSPTLEWNTLGQLRLRPLYF